MEAILIRAEWNTQKNNFLFRITEFATIYHLISWYTMRTSANEV